MLVVHYIKYDFEEPIREGWMVVYMDDVLNFSKNAKEHLGHLRRAFEQVRKNQWVLNKDKCSFSCRRLPFWDIWFLQQGFNLILSKSLP